MGHADPTACVLEKGTGLYASRCQDGLETLGCSVNRLYRDGKSPICDVNDIPGSGGEGVVSSSIILIRNKRNAVQARHMRVDDIFC